jgi:hypothetical protein
MRGAWLLTAATSVWMVLGALSLSWSQEVAPTATAREVGELRMQIARLEERLRSAEVKGADDKNVGIALMAAAGLCALWAQNTGRSAWLWFFFGLILSPIAVIAMLYKNARDRDARRFMDGGDRERRHELLRRAVTGEPDPTQRF